MVEKDVVYVLEAVKRGLLCFSWACCYKKTAWVSPGICWCWL